MKAIILAAGQSSRFWPINHKHKSLTKIMGRPLIFYTVLNLKKAGIKEVIIVQGPKKDIENEFKNIDFNDIKISYVVQSKPLGTGDALKKVKDFVTGYFLVLNGDDYYGANDIKKCLKEKPCILLKKVPNPQSFGQVLVEKNKVKKMVEKPEKTISDLVNTGLYFLDSLVFKQKIKKSKRGEYELVDFLEDMIKENNLEFEIAKDWLSVSYAWDLFDLNFFLLNKMKREILGKIEKGAVLKGPVFVGKDSVVKSGSYIEGPVYIGNNCQIGPNCLIRKFTTINDNCHIGQAVEIKNSIIGEDSRISHLSYLGDSIVGRNCNLGASTISANFRFDEKTIKIDFNGKKVDTRKDKLGVILGSNVKTGVNVSFMPGKLIGSDCLIGPHLAVFENLKDKTVFTGEFKKNKKKTGSSKK